MQSAFWKTMDKVCPCCAMSSVKYAVGENKADPTAKLYEGVDNTLEPVRCGRSASSLRGVGATTLTRSRCVGPR